MSELDRVQHTKLSDAIVHRIEALILDGSWGEGERIPSERELARLFEVSRPSIREAIQKLDALGLLIKVQGGGTFVARSMSSQTSESLLELLASHPESQLDLIEFRHALESVSAYFAALRGTDPDLERIQVLFDAASEPNLDSATHADALVTLYQSIAEASHNRVLLHLVRGLSSILRDNVFKNLEQLKHRSDVLAQMQVHRKALIAAILKREPEQARAACNAHLAYIEEILLEVNREHGRIQRALRRSGTHRAEADHRK